MPTPKHYKSDKGIQPIDLIEAFDLGFREGNVIKYICRAGKKDGETYDKDIEKAYDYMLRLKVEKDLEAWSAKKWRENNKPT